MLSLPQGSFSRSGWTSTDSQSGTTNTGVKQNLPKGWVHYKPNTPSKPIPYFDCSSLNFSIVSHADLCPRSPAALSVSHERGPSPPSSPHTQSSKLMPVTAPFRSLLFLRRTTSFFVMKNTLESAANSKHNNHWLGTNPISIKPGQF